MRFRVRKLQVTRRVVQFLAVAVMLAIPAIARYGNYLAARELDKTLEKWDGTLQGATLGALDGAFRALPGGEMERAGRVRRDRKQVLSYAQQLRGGPWSAEIVGVSMTDPLAASESIVASRRFPKVLLISLILPVVVTLLLGRVFCSWICPMNLLLEFADKLRGLLRFLELRVHDIVFSRWIRYTLLVVGLVLVAFLSMPVLGYIYPPAIIGREAHDLVFALFDRAEAGRFGFSLAGLTWMSLILLAIVVLEVAVSKRWWCRYVCPGGALYGLIGWVRPVRVKIDRGACTDCERCEEVCPVGVSPFRDGETAAGGSMALDCDNCGECISYCPEAALDYGLALRSAGKPTEKEDRS